MQQNSLPFTTAMLPLSIGQSFFNFNTQQCFGYQNPSSSLQALEELSNSLIAQNSDKTSINKPEVQRISHKYEKAALPSKNRYDRPYISGRPLLTCDRKKIVDLFDTGLKKIQIAKQLGITHSCVSKVLRRYHETGFFEARICRTASCSCPGSADVHDIRYCRHLQRQRKRLPFTIENLLRNDVSNAVYYSKLL